MRKNQLTATEAARLLSAADNILLLTHKNPDGDTLGSAAALCLALRQVGKTAYLLNNSTATGRYLPFFEPVAAPPSFSPSFVAAVDMADLSLAPPEAGPFADRIDLCIDHHPSNTFYAKETFLRAEAGATGELAYEIVRALGASLTRDIARLLYLAIATDTGCFRYANTTPTSLRYAADMLDFGIDSVELNTVFFLTKSRPRFEVERRVMETMEFYRNGSVCLCLVTEDILRRAGAGEDDVDNISAFPRSIEGVELGIVLREQAGGVKVSIRTSDLFDASAICLTLGGGGHKRAAGAFLPFPMGEAKRRVLAAIGEGDLPS
ncbi:bifunctional oligoribonuclease/PAP phosphatase NrnA [Oscillospiraceae bacterium OttesenSCG-928-G22]|nr:bifunctional oligoribonuclease/PAP phosphatase NrnA [Oscillospiraceae bacterium OttesenSCG-928-G22]